MDVKEIKSAGRKYGVLYALAGLVLAAILYLLLTGDIPAELFLPLSVAAAVILLLAHFYGPHLAQRILVKGKSPGKEGIVATFIILSAGTLAGASIGFLKHGIGGEPLSDSAFDYLFKPLFWVLLAGFLPSLLIGYLLGYQIKNQGAD